jgi:hypothetical protein
MKALFQVPKDAAKDKKKPPKKRVKKLRIRLFPDSGG